MIRQLKSIKYHQVPSLYSRKADPKTAVNKLGFLAL